MIYANLSEAAADYDRLMGNTEEDGVLVQMGRPDTFVPPHDRESLIMYILIGQPTGDFLYAILTNDLQSAVGRADMLNTIHFATLVRWVFNYAPMNCKGTPAAYDAWRTRGGLKGSVA